MIARVWHGWTSSSNAEAYQEVFRTTVLPELDEVSGHLGAYLLRRGNSEEVEFTAITFFDSTDAVRAFAGADYEMAVVTPEARQVLRRFNERARHYDVVFATGSTVSGPRT